MGTSLAGMYAVGAGLFGLMFGSAINALVWRLYVGRSWVKGRSMCPDCGHQLAAKDLVPVLSWLWLHGRCRYCGKRIHWQYPVVETLTAGLFGISGWVLAPAGLSSGVRLGFWLAMLVLLIALAVYDARWMILPDKLMVPLIVAALAYSTTMAVVAHAPRVLLGATVAALAVGVAFYALVAITKGRAMGGGDIKLVFAMGLMLGIQSMIVALMVAFNTAAVLAVVLMAVRRRKLRDQIPFGPFLVGGAIVAFLWGHQIVAWYLRLNGL